nr:methyl-accepting chemotaxis protein [Arcobacter sp. LA11]
MLNNYNITTKIIAAMVFIIIGMSIISISSYLGFKKIGEEIEEIAEYQIPISTLIIEVEKDILEEEILTLRFIIAAKDILSEQFKLIEKHVLKLEKETEEMITKAKNEVYKAVNHNVDEETKGNYKYFLKELIILEKEQLIYKEMLIKLDTDVKLPNYKNLQEDTIKLQKQLEKMRKSIIKLVHKLENFLITSTKNTEDDEREALLTIEIISIIVLIISTIISIILSKFIKNSIKNFQEGLLDFFKYLNNETETVHFLDESKNDEIGDMSKIINKNIESIEKCFEEDKKVIQDTVVVLSSFEKGDLTKRVKAVTSNKSLSNLTNLLNNMAQKLEENIENILNVLSEYENERYINEVDINGLKEHFLKLANGINSLGSSISNSLIEGREDAYKLQNSSSHLKNNMNDLSQSSLNAATSLEETAAALEEITRTMSSNTNNIAKMNEYATQVSNTVKNGEILASDTMNAIDEINEQTEAIAEAITVIDQIAFQTNILSLNAAVEASTAGEAGKGFAVVAGEVRNLATRSAEAAKEIKALVENATIKANAGKDISKTMLNEYKNLNNDVKETVELIKNVDDASKEQQLGVEQVNDAVATLDRQTQQNSSIATEANSIADSTYQLSNKILENVNEKEFKGKNNKVN